MRDESAPGAPRGGWVRQLVLSSLILVPCFWQPRIQAGDLGSHIYNAWLAKLIDSGQAPGLSLVPQASNILFDFLLSSMLRILGAGTAQHLAVAASVLIFWWGGVAFLAALLRRPAAQLPGHVLWFTAMAAYGWIFRMGFFNYYLSLGLCFWALALALRGGRRRLAAAVVIALIAVTAHLLPVAWAAGIAVYLYAAGKLAPRYRPFLTGSAILALAGVRFYLTAHFPWQQSGGQFGSAFGADQFLTYASRYLLVSVSWLLCCGLAFLRILRTRGAGRLLLDLRLHVFLVTAAAAALLPSAVLFPTHGNALQFIAQRFSLIAAVLLCGILAQARFARRELLAIGTVTAAFFGMLYVDEGTRNRLEDGFEAAVAQLPPGQRVVSAIWDPRSATVDAVHMLDRACIGRCFSYANYEASTRQFRVRARPGNGIVTADYRDSSAMQMGGYVVRAADLPLYQVVPCAGGHNRLCAEPMRAGQKVRPVRVRLGWWSWKVLPSAPPLKPWGRTGSG